MPRVRCPRCQAIVDFESPAKPVCQTCGYGAPAVAPAASPARGAPAPTWNPGMQAPYASFPSMRTTPARPGIATAAGVIQIVFGGLAVLAGIFLLALAGLFGAADEAGGWGDLVAVVFLIIALGALVVGGIQLVAGIGLLRDQNWARMLTIILAFLSITLSLASFSNRDLAGSIMTNLVSIGVSVFLLVAMFQKDVAAHYAARSA